MRQPKIITSLLLFFIFVSSAQAQTGDWQAVMNLPPGTHISVKAAHHMRMICSFESATDDELVCEPRPIRSGLVVYGPSDLVYDRQSICEVRLEHSDAANQAIGGAIGAGAGAGLGAIRTNPTLTRSGGAILGALLGGVIGAATGRLFPIFHGKVIYKR